MDKLSVAIKVSNAFYTEERDTGDVVLLEETALTEKENEAVKGAVMKLTDSLNFDYAYQMLSDAFDGLADALDDTNDIDDIDIHEIASYAVPIHTTKLTGFLHASPSHVYFLEQVHDEYGSVLNGFQLLHASYEQAQIEAMHLALDVINELAE